MSDPLDHYRFVATDATEELPAGFTVFYDSPEPPYKTIEVGWAPDYGGAIDIAEVIEDHRGNL